MRRRSLPGIDSSFSFWQIGPVVVRAPGRRALLTALLGSALIVLALLCSLTFGQYGLSPVELLRILNGGGTPFEQWVLWHSRLPRALSAIGAGAALGASGAVFQTLTRNALGSPDIIGINAGASAGAVLCLLFLPVLPLAVGALFGVLTVLALFVIGLGGSWHLSRNLILIGIAINALALALVQFVLVLVRRQQAQQLLGYLSGSLAYRDWHNVATIAIILAIAVPGLLLLTRRLGLLALGSETATALGNRVQRTQWQALSLATLLALGAVLTAGPVAFVALVAPHLARFRHPRLAIMRSALYGSLLLLGADTVTLMLPGDQRLPVGILTAAIGGCYLAILLLLETRSSLPMYRSTHQYGATRHRQEQDECRPVTPQ